MIGVTILDRDQYGTLVPTLSELLTLLTGPAMLLTWILSDVEAVGSEAEALQEAAEADRRLTFDELLQLAKGVAQVIDGEFVGYDSHQEKRLVIRAVDSSAFDVESDDETVVRLVEGKFSQTMRYDG